MHTVSQGIQICQVCHFGEDFTVFRGNPLPYLDSTRNLLDFWLSVSRHELPDKKAVVQINTSQTHPVTSSGLAKRYGNKSQSWDVNRVCWVFNHKALLPSCCLLVIATWKWEKHLLANFHLLCKGFVFLKGFSSCRIYEHISERVSFQTFSPSPKVSFHRVPMKIPPCNVIEDNSTTNQKWGQIWTMN